MDLELDVAPIENEIGLILVGPGFTTLSFGVFCITGGTPEGAADVEGPDIAVGEESGTVGSPELAKKGFDRNAGATGIGGG